MSDLSTNLPRSTAPRLTMNATEAAKAIGISPRLLWSMTNRGEVPHARIGRRVLYPIAALEAWLDAQAKGGDSNE